MSCFQLKTGIQGAALQLRKLHCSSESYSEPDACSATSELEQRGSEGAVQLKQATLHLMQKQATGGFVSVVMMICLLLPKRSAGFLLPDEQF